MENQIPSSEHPQDTGEFEIDRRESLKSLSKDNPLVLKTVDQIIETYIEEAFDLKFLIDNYSFDPGQCIPLQFGALRKIAWK
jgi:hypothetical protein